MQKLLMAWADGLLAALAAIAPGAFGSMVAVIYEWDPGLTWRQRLAQWIAGICVSYYVGRLLALAFGWDGFGVQSISFVTGMIAFKAAPRFIGKATDAIGDIPADLRERLLGLLDRILPKRGER
jgi:hypothetical protein